jgi:hypothetical protein
LTFADINRFQWLATDTPFTHRQEFIDVWTQRVGALKGSKPRHLVVDLAASDTQLSDAFSEWIKQQRTTTPALGFSTKDENKLLATWHNHYYLAYFDLTIWKRFEATTLNEFDLLRLLYPPETKDKSDALIDTLRSRLRKHKDNVPSIFSPENVFQLLTS